MTALGIVGAIVVIAAIATPSEFDFVYGCGTGCAVRSKQISPIYRATLNGKPVSKARFLMVFTGAGRGNDNGSRQSYVIASCQEKSWPSLVQRESLTPGTRSLEPLKITQLSLEAWAFTSSGSVALNGLCDASNCYCAKQPYTSLEEQTWQMEMGCRGETSGWGQSLHTPSATLIFKVGIRYT